MLGEIAAWLDSSWFALLIGIYILGMVLYGHKKGMVRLAVSFSALFIALVAAKTALPRVTDFLREHTKIEAAIEGYILRSSGIDLLDAEQVNSAEDQRQIIEGLQFPEGIRKLLAQNNSSEIWEKLGAERFQQYIAEYLGRIILGYVGFAILFIIILILLQLFLRIADYFTALPVIHGLNQIGGALLGFGEALICIWIFFMILGMFEGTAAGRQLLALVRSSSWLNVLYQNNVVAFFLKGLVGAML